MPVNKFALIRYRVIDRCLLSRSHPFPTKEDLRRACEEALYGSADERISISTIEKDLWAMRNESELGYYAPIRYDAQHRGYCYEDPEYSIHDISLSEDEWDAVQFAARTLLQFRDVPLFAQFDQALGKIADRLSLAARENQHDLEAVVQFEANHQMGGSEHLQPLFQAIRDRLEVVLMYRKFGAASARPYRVHPYLLKEYRNRWYLIAWAPDRDDVLTFGLDRTEIIEVTDLTFRVMPDFDPDRFFAHSIGITELDAEPRHVVLRCDAVQAHYFQTQPVHPSQRIFPLEDGRYELRLYVLLTYELVHLILGAAPAIEAVSPPELREQVRQALHAASSLHV
jgi:predicted DNA-binding transcriptional regulator YafY